MTGDTRGAGGAPRVAFVVVNWNQTAVTLECLRSLERLDYPAFDVILVDNASDDDAVQVIGSAFPAVQVLRNPENLGFVGGNNRGIDAALAGGAEFIMLLNNDTVVAPDMLLRLLEVMRADPTIGISGPKMLYFDQPDVIWCAGNHINRRTGDSVRLRAEERDVARAEPPQEVDFITGCAICLRREVIESIGLLDARFFIYYEETDWCTRARAIGWETVYVPDARLWHKVSATMGATSPATDYYMTRNALLYLAKNNRGLLRWYSVARAAGRALRVSTAYTVKSRSPHRLRSRNARLLGLRDALLGRWGKMGADVSRACYGS